MNNIDFGKFNKKIKIENIIKSIICGLSSGIIVDALLVILFKLLALSNFIWLHIIITLLLGTGFTFLFLKYVFIPKDKAIAKRLDKDAALEERVKTMVEFKNDESLLANLQRQDAQQKLEETPIEKFKMRFSFSNFILSILALIALPIAILVPSRKINPAATVTDSSSSESNPESESPSEESSPSENPSDGGSEGQDGDGSGEQNDEERDQQIQDAIDDMKQDVDNTQKPDDQTKEDLKDKLDDLKDNLQNANDQEETDQAIDQSKEDIDQTIDDQITKDEIGEALQKHDPTSQVGEDVAAGDSEQTKDSLDEMRDSLKDKTGDELQDAMDSISDSINDALEESGVNPEDSLYQAFKNLADNLDKIDPNSDSAQQEIDDAFEQAKEEISDALDKQQELEDLKDTLDQKLDDLKEQLDNQDGQEGEDQDGDGQEGDGQEGDGQEGKDNQDDSDSSSSGEGSGSGSGDIQYASDDLIYDPATGNYVTYGELLNYYYSQALDGIENGNIPDDLATLIEQYFNSLYYDDGNENN